MKNKKLIKSLSTSLSIFAFTSLILFSNLNNISKLQDTSSNNYVIKQLDKTPKSSSQIEKNDTDSLIIINSVGVAILITTITLTIFFLLKNKKEKNNNINEQKLISNNSFIYKKNDNYDFITLPDSISKPIPPSLVFPHSIKDSKKLVPNRKTAPKDSLSKDPKNKTKKQNKKIPVLSTNSKTHVLPSNLSLVKDFKPPINHFKAPRLKNDSKLSIKSLVKRNTFSIKKSKNQIKPLIPLPPPPIRGSVNKNRFSVQEYSLSARYSKVPFKPLNLSSTKNFKLPPINHLRPPLLKNVSKISFKSFIQKITFSKKKYKVQIKPLIPLPPPPIRGFGNQNKPLEQNYSFSTRYSKIPFETSVLKAPVLVNNSKTQIKPLIQRYPVSVKTSKKHFKPLLQRDPDSMKRYRESYKALFQRYPYSTRRYNPSYKPLLQRYPDSMRKYNSPPRPIIQRQPSLIKGSKNLVRNSKNLNRPLVPVPLPLKKDPKSSELKH